MKEGEPVKGYLKLSQEKLERTVLNHEGNRLEAYKDFETDEAHIGVRRTDFQG